ncbi:MAG: hypothetical protein D6706_06660, partial [Chloroflexi bacterium]
MKSYTVTEIISELAQTCICPKCGAKIQKQHHKKHAEYCTRLPNKRELEQIREQTGMTYSQLAKRYGVRTAQIQQRLVSTHVDIQSETCKRCTIRVFNGPQPGVPFVAHINFNVSGFCPG